MKINKIDKKIQELNSIIDFIELNILEDDFTITEINNTEKILEDYLLENADIEAIIE